MRYADNSDYHVALMPLSDENRAKFNEKAAQEFYFKTEGLPYGLHNFLFSSIDTPRGNYPKEWPHEIFPTIISTFEYYDGSVVVPKNFTSVMML